MLHKIVLSGALIAGVVFMVGEGSTEGGEAMEPRIVEMEELTLVGMVFYGDPFKDAGGWSEENEIGKLWSRFGAKEESVENVTGDGGYEVHIEPEEYKETNKYYVFVGVRVGETKNLPLEMFVKILPAGTYAVFTLKGDEITSDWSEAIYKKWLPSSAYQERAKFLIEYYDGKRFKGMSDPDSELDIYVPIEKAE
jgi:AraC family transcriptional regulator